MNLLKSTAIALVLSANVSAFAASADERAPFDGTPQSYQALRSALNVDIPGAGAPKRAKAAADNINALFANPEAVAKALGLSKLDAKSIRPFVQTAEAGDEQFEKFLVSKGLLKDGAPVSDDSDDEDDDDRAPAPAAPTDAKLLKNILESKEFAAQLKMIKTTLTEAKKEADTLPADASKKDKDELAKRIADLEVGVQIAEALKKVNVDQIVGQEEEITKHLEMIAHIEADARRLSRELAAANEAKAQTVQAMTKLQEEMTELNTRFTAAQDENKQAIEAKDKEIEGFTSQVTALTDQITALGHEKGLLETRVADLQAALDDAKKDSAGTAKIEQLEGELQTAQNDLNAQADAMTALETDRDQAKTSLATAEAELATVKGELEGLKASNTALANEAAKLAAAIGGFPATETDLSVIMREALSNNKDTLEAYPVATDEAGNDVLAENLPKLVDYLSTENEALRADLAKANAAAPAAAAATGFDAQAFIDGLMPKLVSVGKKGNQTQVFKLDDLLEALGLENK